MSLSVLGNPKHEPNVGCHRSDHCKQTPLGSAGVNSRCARPEEPQITKLPCIDRSSVRCGHTSGRHFGKHAQRLFLSSRCSKSLAFSARKRRISRCSSSTLALGEVGFALCLCPI